MGTITNASESLQELLEALQRHPDANLPRALGNIYFGDPASPAACLEACIHAWDLANDAFDLVASSPVVAPWAQGAFSTVKNKLAFSILQSDGVGTFLKAISSDDRLTISHATTSLLALGLRHDTGTITTALRDELLALQAFIVERNIPEELQAELTSHIYAMLSAVEMFASHSIRIKNGVVRFTGEMVLTIGKLPPEDPERLAIADRFWLALSRMSVVESLGGPYLVAGADLALRLLEGGT